MRLARRSKVADLLVGYESSALTYPDVGATSGSLPSGYRHARQRGRLGAGVEVFERASRAVLSLDMHRKSGLVVTPDREVAPDLTMLLGLPVGPLLLIPCRVVYVVDEPRRRGFAYGTLPDHPVVGEEAFIVSHDEDDSVFFDITAFSRPGSRLVRMSGPGGRAVQRIATRKYIRALKGSAR